MWATDYDKGGPASWRDLSGSTVIYAPDLANLECRGGGASQKEDNLGW